jgi:hypothetical protein
MPAALGRCDAPTPPSRSASPASRSKKAAKPGTATAAAPPPPPPAKTRPATTIAAAEPAGPTNGPPPTTALVKSTHDTHPKRVQDPNPVPHLRFATSASRPPSRSPVSAAGSARASSLSLTGIGPLLALEPPPVEAAGQPLPDGSGHRAGVTASDVTPAPRLLSIAEQQRHGPQSPVPGRRRACCWPVRC